MRRQVVDRRQTLLALALAACLPLLACEAGTVNSEDGALLSLAGPQDITLYPGESVDLAWLLVRQSSGPEEGHSIVFTVASAAADHGCTLSQPSGTTDGAGLAGTTFRAGDHVLARPLQVWGSVTSIPVGEPTPEDVAFSITIADPLRLLRPEPPDRDRYDGTVGGRVALAVRASTDGNRPLVGENVMWEVTGGGAGASFTQASTTTDLRGIARTDLQCGPTPSTVTLTATMVGTTPVELTVQVLDWGSCEDDSDCPPGWDCIGDICMEPVPDCTIDGDCPDGQRCRFGECVTASTGDGCKLDEECPEGETCVAGICTGCEGTECPCASLDDCPEGFHCVDGECVCEGPDCGGDPPCEEDDPDLTGSWDVDSSLHLREALPDWLDDVLGALGPIFRFLSDGILGGFDFDIPIIGDALEDAADSLVGRYVPPWLGELMGAIADVNDILSTLLVSQEMNLWGAGAEDEYNGTLEWREVEMTWRGDVVRGRMEEITGFDMYAEDYIDAESICGTFYVHRHDVAIAFGTIVRWILDVIVTAVTDGEYFSLEDLLYSLVDYCDDLAMAIDDLAYDLGDGLGITLPDVYSIAYDLCEAGIELGTSEAIRWLEDIMISSDAMTLGGHADIESPVLLDEGVWEGSLVGRDFSGDWTADKR